MTTNTPVPLPCAIKKRRISFTAVFYALVVGSALLLWYYAWNNLSGGWFHADRMNGIVEAVRRQQFGENEAVIFRVEDFSRPETLQPLQHSVMQPEPNIWARKKNGALQVAIITRDSGHIGEYGFVYSEMPVTVTREGSTYYDVIGPMMELGGKIDDHWWRAANRDR